MIGSRLLWMLDGDGRPVPAPDVRAWGAWMEVARQTDARRVALTTVGSLTVSTVFLGMDGGYGGTRRPLLYETMILGGDREYCERYATRVEAAAGHALAVKIAEQDVRERASSREP